MRLVRWRPTHALERAVKKLVGVLSVHAANGATDQVGSAEYALPRKSVMRRGQSPTRIERDS